MSSSPEERNEWVLRIQEAQRRRTPEQMEAAIQQAEESRRLVSMERKARAARSHTLRTRGLALCGLRQMAVSSSADEFSQAQSRWTSAQETSDRLQQRRLEQITEDTGALDPNHEVAFVRSDSAVSLCEAEEVADVLGLESVSDLRQFTNVQANSDDEGAGDVELILDRLKVEPQDEAELAAKFSLYTGYSDEVAKMRGTLCTFWDESRAGIPKTVASSMERVMKGIDEQRNLAIPEGRQEWFVYHMMKQAARNNQSMANILTDFQQRLKYLASNTQSECPICIEPFTESGPRAPETLGCCHKVCKECWENWSSVMQGRPFCPLCKHTDFISRVAAGAARDTARALEDLLADHYDEDPPLVDLVAVSRQHRAAGCCQYFRHWFNRMWWRIRRAGRRRRPLLSSF